jgi:ATP-dependent helicase/nuclease subunit B
LELLAKYPPEDILAPGTAERLYGATLKTSVSALEQYAACPFRFFLQAGLRLEERRLFEVSAKERGSFQHEVLARFHRDLAASGLRWRDISPGEGRRRIADVAAKLTVEFGQGLFEASPVSAFAARRLTASLQDFVEMTIRWMETYGFDPAQVELAFGGSDAVLPGWELGIDAHHRLLIRGKIDRVDLAPVSGADETWCVVVDYKSSRRLLDSVLMAHGVQLQLPAYLAAIQRVGAPQLATGGTRLKPAGMFYVNLRGHYQTGKSRRDVLEGAENAREVAYQHRGRFSLEALEALNRRHPDIQSRQFSYRLTRAGVPQKNARDPLDPEAFGRMLSSVETRLRTMGQQIFQGDIRVDPYQKGAETACAHCPFSAICRVDPWTQDYRVLKEADPELEHREE